LSIGRIAEYALAHETPWSRDIAEVLANSLFEPPPDNEVIGPVRPRGGPSGIVWQGARELVRWGDPHRNDITFSVAKSYLSILAGIAFDAGLIRDVHEPVSATVDDDAFRAPNEDVTWHQLLQQTSEWQGSLWGKSEKIDRGRQLGLEGRARKGDRAMRRPGEFWEYNDVRVNVLSFALLMRFRRPLPEVFAEKILRPLGAEDAFEWHGYRTSWMTLDGRRVQSVSGGSHWGGGVFISAADQLKIGRMMLDRGSGLLSETWIERSLQPCPLEPTYGYMWWLNTGRKKFPSAGAGAFYAIGAGGNVTWIEPERGLVAAARWLDPAAQDGFMRTVLEEAG
jgi:CubicO group peptidase (beta-lactamase class C family)